MRILLSKKKKKEIGDGEKSFKKGRDNGRNELACSKRRQGKVIASIVCSNVGMLWTVSLIDCPLG